MLLPTTEPMITSMSQMILDRAGLRLLVMLTVDLTISGKSCPMRGQLFERIWYHAHACAMYTASVRSTAAIKSLGRAN